MITADISIFVACVAGVLSFFSPCVLPLLPAYILYIGGSDRTRRIINSAVFILGFSLVFVSFGLMVGLARQVLLPVKEAVRLIGGSLIVLFGLYMMGVFRLPFLDVERRFRVQSKQADYAGAFVLGVTFGAAWSPCVGPILGSILILAGTAETAGYGILLLVSYAAGLALPFFLTSISVNTAAHYFKRLEKHLMTISRLSGLFLVLLGLLLLTNYLQPINDFLLDLFNYKGL